MYQSKIIFYLIFLSFLILGCKKKDKIPKEYFSFDANGVHYEYSQDVKYGFGMSRRAIYALPSSVGYLMVGSSFKNPTSPGTITFNFAENQIPTEDTVILDGISNIVTIEAFDHYGDNYQLLSSLPGKIIFTERSSQMLSGTFEFSAELYRTPSFNVTVWTDTFLHITNGKFSIIPSL